MDFAIHVLKLWLLLVAGFIPLIAFMIWVRMRVGRFPSHLVYTRPSEVPADRPLIEIRGGVVHYLGGQQHPLPQRFGIFDSLFFVWFFPSWFLWNVLHHYGASWLWSVIGAVSLFQLPLMAVIHIVFRRLQPKWINQHLATLPDQGSASSPGDQAVAAVSQ